MNSLSLLLNNQLSHPLVMGILNITTDSFSDGNKYLDEDASFAHASKLISDGAAIIDIGAESTRPGSSPVNESLELSRIIPALEYVKRTHPNVSVSIDTRKSSVAMAALTANADIINDISAAQFDPALAEVFSSYPEAKIILMHMQGQPETMQNCPRYDNVIDEVKSFLTARIEFCLRKGIKLHNIMIDPGIGFGKNLRHNLTLIREIDSFASFGLPIVLGASRKSFINSIVPSDPEERLGGSLAAAAWATHKGVAIIRCHDVAQHNQFLKVLSAILNYELMDK